ncbi:MAG: ribosome-binding factor A [Solirubrobacteraceae bacterium]
MATIRQTKINKLIQEELSEIFRQEAKNSHSELLITVSEVRVSPDLGISKVYLSIYPSAIKELVFKEIKEKTLHYKGLLGMRLGKHLRKIPSFTFFLDITLDELEKIEKSLKGEGENPFL